MRKNIVAFLSYSHTWSTWLTCTTKHRFTVTCSTWLALIMRMNWLCLVHIWLYSTEMHQDIHLLSKVAQVRAWRTVIMHDHGNPNYKLLYHSLALGESQCIIGVVRSRRNAYAQNQSLEWPKEASSFEPVMKVQCRGSTNTIAD